MLVHKRWFFLVGAVVAVLSLALFAAACDDDEGDGGEPTATEAIDGGEPTATEMHDEDATPPEGATTVNITLQEWAVIPDLTVAPAGAVTFEIENIGPDAEHEFHVLRTDLEATDLPVQDDGDVIEDDPALETVGEVHEVAVGDTATLTLDLEAGHYALICNIVDETEEGEPRSHYGLGMRVDFVAE